MSVIVKYEPTWSDGHKRPLVEVEVTEDFSFEDGFLTGKDRQGVAIGPIPASWITDVEER